MILKSTYIFNKANKIVIKENSSISDLNLYHKLLNSFWNKTRWEEIFPSLPDFAIRLKVKRKVLIENQDFFRILDRKNAIKFAFENARSGDLVLITGKGAEQWMVVEDKKIPWDDRKIARQLINS